MTASLRLLPVWCAGLALGMTGCVRPPPADVTPPTDPVITAPTPGRPWFVDVTGSSGITFRHFDDASPAHYIQATMGSGVAWIDYDNDGWPDLFFVQTRPTRPPAGGETGASPTHKLYRNNGDGTFTDVTDAAGLAVSDYGMGVAVGDYDNDGFDDLLVTHFGGLRLYHNEADGRGGRRFVDVTQRSRLADPHWATSCAWGDVDGDGLLDLYVCNYVEVDMTRYQPCVDKKTGLVHTCQPTVFPSTKHRLFRNNGDGTFADVTDSSGVGGAEPAAGLGVVMTDLAGGGRLDIYVANDMGPAYLFENQGDGRFVEKALFSGSSLQPNGRFMAGMGVAAGDVDDSGRASLVVTNYYDEPNMLFLNRGRLTFQEWSYPSGLGPPSLSRLGFGTVMLDADLDGRPDLAVANGHISPNSFAIWRAPYAQPAQLFRGVGPAKFEDVSRAAGPYFSHPRVGRGLAWADFDNDGKPDLVFANNGGAPALLHNRTETAHHWARFDLTGDGKRSNRNAIGARLEITAGGRTQVRFVSGGGSYLSASDRRQLVGLGTAGAVDRLRVRWPSGLVQEFGPLPADRGYRLREGGEPEPLPTAGR